MYRSTYNQYLTDPSSLDSGWRDFFKGLILQRRNGETT
ncbi:MAG: hypothetical protein IPK08_06085 [Bacteroidetes bacterium]|nr:hypothetical protein [Bacteroidota bacterium]